MPHRITILHATDLHLRARLPGHSGHAVRRSREIPRLLQQLARRVADCRADLLVLTGDLVDVPHLLLHGTPQAYPTLMAEAVADYALLRRWLESLPCPWQVVPGNHDHPAAFAAVFGPERVAVRHLNGYRIVGFDDWEVRENQAERVGRARDLFEAMLADADPAPQVHLQHYLIRPEVAYGYPLMYRDAAPLAAAIAGAGRVQAVLSGHWHKGEPPLEAAGTTFSVCPAFCEWPHRFRVVSLAPGTTHVETLALADARGRDRRAAGFIGLDHLLGTDRLPLPGEVPALHPDAADMLRDGAVTGRLPVVLFPWNPDLCGWRAVQGMQDAVARAARAADAELDAAYFIVPESLEPAIAGRLPAEGAPTADAVFPVAERELGLDLGRSILAGGDARLAAVAATYGVRHAGHPNPKD